MASDHLIEQLENLASAIATIDKGQTITRFIGRRGSPGRILSYIDKNSEGQRSNMRLKHMSSKYKIFGRVLKTFEMEQQANHSNSDYVAHRPQFLLISSPNFRP